MLTSVATLHKGGLWDFPGRAVVRGPPASAGDIGSTPGPGTNIPQAARQRAPHY